MRSLLFKIIAVLLGFLAAFAVAEGAVRLLRPQEVAPVRFAFDPNLGEIPVPGQQGVRHSPGVYTFAYSNNSLGWRGSREYREKKTAGYRILMLGDSFVYGLGVNDDQTLAARVEKNLTAPHRSVEVMNAGCPGKGTDYELKLFQTVGARFHPDLTVLCFFCNDFEDNERGEYYNVSQQGELTAKPLAGNQGVIKKLLFHLPGYNWLISWSQAANLVKQAGVELLVKEAQHTNPDLTKGLVVSYNKTASGYTTETNKKLTKVYVERLNAAVRQAGGSLMICYIPCSQEVSQYRRTRVISPDETAMQGIAMSAGGAFWSLTPLLALSGQSIDHLYYQEGHWTAAAHALAAEYLSRIISNRLTQPPGTSN
ncbi:MAG: GDSL-type esterase/lipase family protein [Syntrophobacterales bacterium]|jgi:hypothetical protein|nr:GDSL-type esterase/lipase family protein [Syntrophobacterales bacterium]